MNRKMAMAIRTVCGYSDDLSKKLPTRENGYTEPVLRMASLMFKEFAHVFPNKEDLAGAEFDDPEKPFDDPKYLIKVRDFIDREAEKVCLGIVDD